MGRRSDQRVRSFGSTSWVANRGASPRQEGQKNSLLGAVQLRRLLSDKKCRTVTAVGRGYDVTIYASPLKQWACFPCGEWASRHPFPRFHSEL